MSSNVSVHYLLTILYDFILSIELSSPVMCSYSQVLPLKHKYSPPVFLAQPGQMGKPSQQALGGLTFVREKGTLVLR